jgi:hypothetical protein
MYQQAHVDREPRVCLGVLGLVGLLVMFFAFGSVTWVPSYTPLPVTLPTHPHLQQNVWIP